MSAKVTARMTPTSMRKGSQVFRKPAKLKRQRRNVEVRRGGADSPNQVCCDPDRLRTSPPVNGRDICGFPVVPPIGAPPYLTCLPWTRTRRQSFTMFQDRFS